MAMKISPRRLKKRALVRLSKILGGLLVGLGLHYAQADVAYFLVASQASPPNDSYVLPISKPEDIAEARRELNELPFTNRLIIVARIAAGADGINRDHLATGKPMWSWHVTEFLQFAEGVIETLDGTPTLVEQRQTNWVDEKSGAIGFVGHRISAELTPEQLFFAVARHTAEGVRLDWLELGTNYLYTVEFSDSLNSANWAPAVRGSWPTTSANWTDSSLPASGARFYRVKAQLKNP